MPNKAIVTDWFKSLQDDICKQLETLDGDIKYREDLWDRPEGGGGRTRVFQGGDLIEKGGVNFSAVEGPLPEKIRNALKLEQADFFATGVSIVLHPISPMMPIIHMNVRYFEIDENTWWFGGGIDVTPHYVKKDDAKAFHEILKAACDKHHADSYPKYKKWADDYFYLPHRQETRGIGGIFFDRLNQDKAHDWEFVKNVGSSFMPIYHMLTTNNRTLPYAEEELGWQALRRSRYVEFNLVWDKGTKFGLDTNGRTESILMSMPPIARWEYDYQPAAREQATLDLLKKDIDWIIGS